MAARIGFSFATLRRIDPSACDTDARLIWKEGDAFNMAIAIMTTPLPRLVQSIHVSSARELRLLGQQMLRRADELEECDDDYEVIVK